MADSNPCVRCGKERIMSKSWKKYIGTSLVTYSSFICPDEKCQEIVDAEFKKKKDHIEAVQANSLKRKKENKRNKKSGKV